MKNWQIIAVIIIMTAVSSIMTSAQTPLELDFMPNEIETNPVTNEFLMMSHTQSTIYQISEDGNIAPFIEDDAITNVMRMAVDNNHNRLYVINADITAAFEAIMSGGSFSGGRPDNAGQSPAGGFGGGRPDDTSQPPASGFGGRDGNFDGIPPVEMLAHLQLPVDLLIYDLDSQQRLFHITLSNVANTTSSFINNITVDSNGTAYLTDSGAGVLYSVDLTGNISILSSDLPTSDEFNQFIIVYHPDNFLLLGSWIDGAVYKFDLVTLQLIPVVLSSDVDGVSNLILMPDMKLLVVNLTDVWAFESQDRWDTATVIPVVTGTSQIVASTMRDNILYAVQLGEDAEVDLVLNSLYDF